MTNIYYTAFSKCYYLVSLYLPGPIVASLYGSSVFSLTPIAGFSDLAGTVGSVFVPESLYAAYVTAYNWSYLSSRIVSIPSE